MEQLRDVRCFCREESFWILDEVAGVKVRNGSWAGGHSMGRLFVFDSGHWWMQLLLQNN